MRHSFYFCRQCQESFNSLYLLGKALLNRLSRDINKKAILTWLKFTSTKGTDLDSGDNIEFVAGNESKNAAVQLFSFGQCCWSASFFARIRVRLFTLISFLLVSKVQVPYRVKLLLIEKARFSHLLLTFLYWVPVLAWNLTTTRRSYFRRLQGNLGTSYFLLFYLKCR